MPTNSSPPARTGDRPRPADQAALPSSWDVAFDLQSNRLFRIPDRFIDLA